MDFECAIDSRDKAWEIHHSPESRLASSDEKNMVPDLGQVTLHDLVNKPLTHQSNALPALLP
jgi:hypothetical protein